MRPLIPMVLLLHLATVPPVTAQVVHAAELRAAPCLPYDFAAADALLNAELSNLEGHVAVILRQDGTDIYRFQAGDIQYNTKTRLASFTKTISAGVILALCDEGLLGLTERIGDAFPLLFEAGGLGDPTVLDCWAMRHGIETPFEFHRNPAYTLPESVYLIGATGGLAFSPGTRLGYTGLAMQIVAQIATMRTGQPWEQVARTRILDPCGMPDADYQQFAPNPAVAGGLRSSALETMGYAQMIIDRGQVAGQRVLSQSSIERMFTNATRGLTVHASPWPARHPMYPYGTDPDYAFGCWVLAEDPATQHVEEILGSGAWGSHIWIDRRRGLTAVLITDVAPGSFASVDAALGFFDIARTQVEAAQARNLVATPVRGGIRLAWQSAAVSTATRVYGSSAPIRDLFDLRAATGLGQTAAGQLVVPQFPYYAVTALCGPFENTALVPGNNALQ